MRLLRGASPSPRHRLAGATPHRAAAQVPNQFIRFPSKLSMWGNDTYGNCVTAEEAYAKACHSPEIFIPENQVIQWAKSHGFLNGADLISVLDMMETNGFVLGSNSYEDGPSNSVDWTNPSILRSAIFSGPVKIGVAADQLENVCNAYPNFQSNGWFASGLKPDSNEDHCVSLTGFGSVAWLAGQLKVPIPPVKWSTPAYAVFTWDSIGIIDVPSMLAITAEAWVRNPTTVVK